MKQLVPTIDEISAKLDVLRRHGLKETSTRRIVIDPILEALGWDVCDPDEVELEYPTIDGRSVDYALKLNRRPALLVEAKSLDDPLDNVKSEAQIVRYAAAEGIVWCVLTNGIRWKVYRSIEECAAPEKLMFEVSIDPKDCAGVTASQLAKQMWRFSREELAKGTLDALGEQTFTDGKVSKALDTLLGDPPRKLVNLVREKLQDKTVSPQRIKESLRRLRDKTVPDTSGAPPFEPEQVRQATNAVSSRRTAARESWATRTRKTTRSAYGEDHHTAGKPQEVLALYRGIDRECLSMRPGGVQRRYLAKSITYETDGRGFCSVHLQRAGLRVWLYLKFHRLSDPPAFARDVSNIGHWGGGDLELSIKTLDQIQDATRLIRASFQARCEKAG